MAEPKRPPRSTSTHRQRKPADPPRKAEQPPPPPPSWAPLKGVFACNSQQAKRRKHKKKKQQQQHGSMRCSVSICNTRDVSEVVKGRPEAVTPKDPGTNVGTLDSRHGSRKTPLKEINGPRSSAASSHTASSSKMVSTSCSSASSSSSSSASVAGPFRGVAQLRRFSGCYECHSVVDPIRELSREASLRSAVSSCPDCGQVFLKPESLELHQAVRHAVSELGPEDTSRNVVEIIFQSSWLKKPAAGCKIDRILKINNTKKTISRFEDYRDAIKAKARQLRKNPRCMADGNELLRFHSTTFTCSIGFRGSTTLCHSIPSCRACSIIRDGFRPDPAGRIGTMGGSGRAHDSAARALPAAASEDERRAMLVCRVVAGRVKKAHDVSAEEHDSVAGACSNLEELFVFSARAILPCFLVVYREV